MKLLNSTQRIVKVNGHYEAYDCFGNFLCSGDTMEECEDECVKMICFECAR